MPPMRAVFCLVLAVAVPAAAAQPTPAATLPATTSQPTTTDAEARRARPERPTVATHAFAVARGRVELEAGVAAADDGPSAVTLVKMGIASRVQLSLSVERSFERGRPAAENPLSAGVKWQLGAPRDGWPSFALLPGVTLSRVARATSETALSLMAIATHALGPVGVDVNLAATRLDGTRGPTPYLWAVAATIPLAGRVAWGLEVSGERVEETAPIRHALAFVNFTVHPGLVLDAGWTRALRGEVEAALFAGVTWNFGR